MPRQGYSEEQIKEFLSSYRLGIDLGEAAGGLALLHGTDILHDETYLDFHEATLETRRTLRRGRRTRNAKKMRLARLRSWILRQCFTQNIPGLEVKNGKFRLPDPYRLMRNKKYQTLPGFYRVKGNNPDGADTWVDATKKGCQDAEGFVIALTHIFQKRGYKYDDKDFSDYDDSRLIDFLDSCAMLNEAPEMHKSLEEEIKRREEESGKEKSKLREAFKNAFERKRERKKALPRQVRENDLEDIANAFGKRWSLSPEHIEKWKVELIGLLNKIIRHARFDNRLKSGCSWCGKKTPRLSKPETREEAFKAAVGNLRILQPDGKRRSLNDEERRPLFEWYGKRRENHEFSRGTAKTPVEERAPSEENLRKYLEKIGSSKSWIRSSKGKWKSDFPMLPQLNDLMNRKARGGRARLCVEHMRMQAEGKTMKDAGLEWQTMRRRNAPNPRREQHDARVLKRIERILFHEEKRGADAWRFGPISFITLEVPIPVDLERAKKKELPERKPMTFRERLHGETGGVCIYCGKDLPVDVMHEEHIVPEAKGGPDGQMNRVASCSTCNTGITGKKALLPSEWLSGSKWDTFKRRVEALNLPAFKKQILLLEPGSTYPNDPTPLARVGARWRAFAADIVGLFEKYEVEPPTLNYEIGKPHIQVVRGDLTARLRRDWFWKDTDAKIGNFPVKNRADLYNHSQDAAILAAIPPHTWREKIFCELAIRPCAQRDSGGNIIRDENGKVLTEMRPRPGVAALELAPDWAGFNAMVKEKRIPIVRVLGKLRATWRRQIMDLTFYRHPEDLNATKLYKRELDSETKKRRTVEVPKGGLVINVPHRDGTTGLRKVQVKPIQSHSLILWHDIKGRKDNLNISLERPEAICKFVEHPVDPPIEKGFIRLGRIERGSTLWLSRGEGVIERKAGDKKKKIRQKVELPEGFYRVKELNHNGIIVVHENALPYELAEKIGIPKGEQVKPPERSLGKKELKALFALKGRNKTLR